MNFETAFTNPDQSPKKRGLGFFRRIGHIAEQDPQSFDVSADTSQSPSDEDLEAFIDKTNELSANIPHDPVYWVDFI